jgi:hypothetical protein
MSTIEKQYRVIQEYDRQYGLKVDSKLCRSLTLWSMVQACTRTDWR